MLRLFLLVDPVVRVDVEFFALFEDRREMVVRVALLVTVVGELLLRLLCDEQTMLDDDDEGVKADPVEVNSEEEELKHEVEEDEGEEPDDDDSVEILSE